MKPLRSIDPQLLRWAAIATVLLFVAPALASACPFCDEALAGPGAKGLSRAVGAYKLSMYALVAVPVLLVGGIASRIALSIRRASDSMRVQRPASLVDAARRS